MACLLTMMRKEAKEKVSGMCVLQARGVLCEGVVMGVRACIHA